MELPFLKNKNKQGGGSGTAIVEVRTSDSTSDQTLLEHIADELLTAIEKKDIKSLRESLQALVLSIKDKDQE